MPEGDLVFIVKAPMQSVWALLSDMQKVGSCIPGCEVIVVDEKISNWKLAAKLGFVSRTFELKNQVTELIPPTRSAWMAHGEDIEMAGSLDLASISNIETQVHFRIVINATGNMGKIINNVIDRKIDDYKNEFMKCVKSKLE